MRTIRILRASSFRPAIIYMLLYSLSSLAILGFIYRHTAGFMERQTEETINAEIQGLSEQYRLLGLAGLIHTIRRRTQLHRTDNSYYLLAGPHFTYLAGNLKKWPRAGAPENGRIRIELEEDGEDKELTARYFALRGGFHLLVGRDVSDRIKIQERIVDALAWGIAATVVLGFIGGLFMSRSMLRRLDVINKASGEIMHGDLSRRIPRKRKRRGKGDEYDQLVANLNNMLDRIESLMNGVRQVSDNIAHDLRNPLNRLRGRLEVTRLQQPDAESCRRAIEQAIEEADNLIQTFNALLRIAQAEAGAMREGVEDLELGRIAQDMAEFYEPLAEEKNIAFETDIAEGVCVEGNRHLLTQALANLVDNAIKYTHSGGTVLLSLTEDKSGVSLCVADNGPGIPEEAREKVLERFYRLETSRNTPGSGLGLSLAAAVAKLHKAELELSENEPGLVITLFFPKHDGTVA